TDMTLSPEATTINLNATEQLSLTFTPSNATNQNVTWSSDNDAIVSVNQSGLITGVSLGSTTITVISEEGSILRTCDVIVQNISSSVSGVTLNTNYHLMKTAESFVLMANVEPADATEQGVIWSSDDETIAIVSATGEITTLKQGVVNIKATTIDGGFEASCRVTVLNININKLQFISSKASGGLRLSASDGTTNPILNAAPYPTSSNAKWKITPTNDGAFYIDNQATTANRLSAIASTDSNAEMVSDAETADRAKWYIKYEQSQNGVDYYFIECKANFDKMQLYKKSNTEAGMRTFGANDGGRWFFEEDMDVLSTDDLDLTSNQIILKNRNITVTIAKSYSSANVAIYNLNGKIIVSKKMTSNEMNIRLDNSNTGLYIILLSVDGQQQIKKIMLK
ncbi:Ig-like domain-containing protein, partial [Tamlana sp. I1]|uniref:Ig-like domain-containing protein n=1 Tax=Tamlana sp. I1 TaxID=2762061 RepID=UPI00188F64EC